MDSPGSQEAVSAKMGSSPASEEPVMTDLDSPYSANGGGDHRSGLGSSMPFFPAPPGTPVAPMPGPPLSAQPAPPAQQQPSLPIPGEITRSSYAAEPVQAPAQIDEPVAGRGAVVKGSIKIEDEVVEKIATLAALEVEGVAALGRASQGSSSETLDAVRHRIAMSESAGASGSVERTSKGVQARMSENDIALDIVLVVDYGSIVMEVAKAVKTNVARTVGTMLGMKVTSVNVTIDDVRMPGSD